jgi:hypothetical protein
MFGRVNDISNYFLKRHFLIICAVYQASWCLFQETKKKSLSEKEIVLLFKICHIGCDKKREINADLKK